MHPDKVQRENIKSLTDLPNVGPAFAADLRLLGIVDAKQLVGRDPYALYQRLCEMTQVRQDPCVLDVFLALVDFSNGAPARAWWHYTAQRKQQWPSL
ncbi:MAG: helix-hairpin-helix domain-containing protein [Arenimonas sp.]|nr:helix-hairpin-helix domain-containing protein [Arenimonas sp.]